MYDLRSTFLIGAGFSLAMTMVSPVVADDSNVYINPAIGVQDFDSKRNLKREDLLSIGVEYRFNQHWAAELSAMDSSPELDGGSASDVDLTQYGIDGIYYFKDSDKFQPYGVVGIGHAEFDGGMSEDNETQARLGLGVRYLLSEHWSVKADARMLYGMDDDTVDPLLMVGISYAFNEQSNKPAAAVAMAAADSDGDGVPDASDRCANTPAGVVVDAKGCALDGDKDGVADYRDECPDTPAGRQVDDKGCKFVLTSSEEITLHIKFPTNSSTVNAAYFSEIEEVADFLKKYGAVQSVIEGHTDDTGNADYNQGLSQRRANAVMAVLVERFGIDAKRLTAKGYGESKPIESNESVDGRKANRRVVAVMKAEVES